MTTGANIPIPGTGRDERRNWLGESRGWHYARDHESSDDAHGAEEGAAADDRADAGTSGSGGR